MERQNRILTQCAHVDGKLRNSLKGYLRREKTVELLLALLEIDQGVVYHVVGYLAVAVKEPSREIDCRNILLDSPEPPFMQDTPSRSEEHTSELQSLMRISYAVFCMKTQNTYNQDTNAIPTRLPVN